MEGEERGSESHWDVVGLKRKRGEGGMETGNQLLGWRFAPAAATLNLEVSERENEREMENKLNLRVRLTRR